MLPPPPEPPWSRFIPEADWDLYRRVIAEARARNLPFAVGGGFAFSHYARRWRDTKDIDLYILLRDRDVLVGVLQDLGFTDYFERQPYDRGWIYRAFRDGVIVDLIWASANQHARTTDEQWFARAVPVTIRGMRLDIVPVEELIFTKLYVVQRDRCDWPDLLNVLHEQARCLDWHHLLARVGDDARLLGGLLCVFGWMCAEQARAVPNWVSAQTGALPAGGGPPCLDQQARVRLLDTRQWFGPSLPSDTEVRRYGTPPDQEVGRYGGTAPGGNTSEDTSNVDEETQNVDEET
ncbi:MAG: nucleotidyltransferase [Planctomycetota bacterium]